MENIARTLKTIGHTDDDQHFVKLDDPGKIAGSLRSEIEDHVLGILNTEGNLIGSFDNYLDGQVCSFFRVKHLYISFILISIIK